MLVVVLWKVVRTRMLVIIILLLVVTTVAVVILLDAPTQGRPTMFQTHVVMIVVVYIQE